MDVLLLHAGIADRRMWAPQVDALEAAGHVVHAPDLPGYGEAALEPGTVAYVDFAATQAERPAAVVGCSFGARVALELAAARPELVERLALVSPALGSWEWSAEARAGFDEEEALIEAGDLAGAAAQQARMWLGPDASAEVRELTAAMTLRSYEQQLPVEAEVRAVWPQPSAEERLEEIAVPVLVVYGAEDLPDARLAAELLAGALRRVRLERVDGAAHLPGLEQPEALNRLLLGFLAQP